MDTDRMHSADPLVAAVLTAAAAPAEAPLPGEAAALAAYRHAFRPSRRQRLVHSLVRAKVGVLAVAGGVVLASGVATAATGTLPGVSSLVGHAHSHSHGNGPNPAASSHPSTKGAANGQAPSTGTPTTGPTHPDGETASGSHGNGAAVSRVATTTTTSGVDKGRTVCGTASSERCRVNGESVSSRPTTRPTPHGGATTGVSHRSSTAAPHVTRPTH